MDANVIKLAPLSLISACFSRVQDFIFSLSLMGWLGDFFLKLFPVRKTNYYKSPEAELWFYKEAFGI